MEFLGALTITRKEYDYLFVVVDRFKNMCVLMPYKKTISWKEVKKIFF